MEFCQLLPGQQFKKLTVDPEITTAILKYTPRNPDDRLHLIVESLKATGVLNYQEGNTYLAQAGISIDPSPLRIKGTIISPLQMTFRGRTDIVYLFECKIKRYTDRLTRHLKMAPGTLSLQNILKLH